MISTLETTGSINRDPLTAEHGASTVSNRYGFVSTRTLLDNLQAEGFTPRDIQIARVNKTERQGFQKHIIRLQHADLMPSILMTGKRRTSGKSKRHPKPANHGARACNHVGRRQRAAAIGNLKYATKK